MSANPYFDLPRSDSLELPRCTDTDSNTTTFLTTLNLSPAHPPPSSYTGITSLLPPPAIHHTLTCVTNAPPGHPSIKCKETMLGIAQWIFEWGCLFGFGYGTYLLIFSSISTSQRGYEWSFLLIVPVFVGVMIAAAGVVGVARAVVGGWREWRRVVYRRGDEEEGGEIVLRTPRLGRVERRAGDEEEGYIGESEGLMGGLGLGRGGGRRSSRDWVGVLERIEEDEREGEADEKVGLLFLGR
ncbi:hypothetical protein BGX38DRAFT_1267169 [Terfezia claveryi]|nr:hypothetical protein BGX38DRAFT_1267169 [Terfezia claveryi]